MDRCSFRHLLIFSLATYCFTLTVSAQTAFTWQQIREKFEKSNPTLIAGQIGIEESRAEEVTAFLRPNPTANVSVDQVDVFNSNPYRPLGAALPFFSFDYLHERRHKRELRLESAQKATTVAVSQQNDLERTLLFNVHNAFVQILQAKAVLALAKENLEYYDRVLTISKQRNDAGDLAKVDLYRLQLQRVQFESDVQTADVNLRTAKIQLLALLNDRTPIDKFDISGKFDFDDQIPALDELRKSAEDTRPDLKAAMQSVDKAHTDYKLAVANGSTDPTFGVDYAHNPPLTGYFGFSVSIPLRVFDRNQGEKARTNLDIGRNERLKDATAAQVFSDVDSAYATLNSNLILLRPYKADYLPKATEVREIISFSYRRGAATLLDFLQAQSDYRALQVNYLNLIGAYRMAANQLNMAVGRDVIQ
ncbi:MAG TPA: TolC family protein [Bryobacteraceae bacterium]|jgi:cobalt-zinc-cadmium efflux system outer membrane protein